MFVVAVQMRFNSAPLVYTHIDGNNAWGAFWHNVEKDIPVTVTFSDRYGVVRSAAFSSGDAPNILCINLAPYARQPTTEYSVRGANIVLRS